MKPLSPRGSDSKKINYVLLKCHPCNQHCPHYFVLFHSLMSYGFTSVRMIVDYYYYYYNNFVMISSSSSSSTTTTTTRNNGVFKGISFFKVMIRCH